MRVTITDLSSNRSVDIDVAKEAVIHIRPSPQLPRILSISLIRPVPISDCPFCGSSAISGAIYCTSCGGRLPFISES